MVVVDRFVKLVLILRNCKLGCWCEWVGFWLKWFVVWDVCDLVGWWYCLVWLFCRVLVFNVWLGYVVWVCFCWLGLLLLLLWLVWLLMWCEIVCCVVWVCLCWYCDSWFCWFVIIFCVVRLWLLCWKVGLCCIFCGWMFDCCWDLFGLGYCLS